MSIVTKAETVATDWWAIVPWWVYLIIVLAFGALLQTVRLDHSQKAESTLKTSLATFESTQKTNLAEIDTLKAANAQWAAKFADEVANSKTYLDAANEYAQEQTQKATKAQKTLEAIYAKSPSAKAWSVAHVDLSVAASLSANSGSH